MSLNDFSGRLLGPRMARPRRPLSKRASTASCNIRISFRIITPGAFSSMSRFNRLLRLITRRYRSLRSDVANRPPSNGTKGRSSGGRTGITSMIIHSGLFPDFLNASSTLSRFAYFFFIAAEVDALAFTCNSSHKALISIFLSKSRIASAPIPTLNPLDPYSETSVRNLSSGTNSFSDRSVDPGSTHT